MEQTFSFDVFESHYKFLDAALGIIVFGILFVLPISHSFGRWIVRHR